MNDIKIYSVSDRYIAYLRNDARLKNMFDNKEDSRIHTRKYVGAVLVQNGFNYFIPFSSPKDTDYTISEDGTKEIRKSIVPIIRMTSKDNVSGEVELKGTLKVNNMIPVPLSELELYNISSEQDINYRQIIQKEWVFIRRNKDLIIRNASILYNQKTKVESLFAGKDAPKYLSSTVDFQYAEKKCLEFQQEVFFEGLSEIRL